MRIAKKKGGSMKKSNIEIPQLPKPTSGLVRVGQRDLWSIIYYVDGNQRRKATGTPELAVAQRAQRAFYAKLKEQGASERGPGGRRLEAVADAIKNPNGMACIYTQKVYRVQVGGKTIITTTNLETAKQERNKHIEKNYEL